MRIPRALVEKYAVRGPRYTSYPTAVEFSEEVTSEVWLSTIEDDIAGKNSAFPSPIPHALSLYFHIPFCFQLCYFCACHKIVPANRSQIAPYLAALGKEMETYSRLWPEDIPVEQIHWGGGCPDYLTPEETLQLSRACSDYFPCTAADADISVEVDPRTTSSEHVAAYAEAGFNRISLGVQDFNPAVQTLINRVQSYETTCRVIEEARLHKFHGVNVDLLYGLPEQTEESFSETVSQILQLRPDRIALYGYAHVTWLKKVQRMLEKAHLPTPQERITLFVMALERLTEAGYEYIGMDHFALPDDLLCRALHSGSLNRNFMGYSSHSGARIVGMGASSISSLPTGFAQNEKDISKYIETAQRTGSPIVRGVLRSQDDCLRAEIIEQILCSAAINVRDLEQRWQISFWDYFENARPELEELAKDELIEWEGSVIRLSDQGRVLSRNVAMVFDAYLPKYREQKQRTFSQAV